MTNDRDRRRFKPALGNQRRSHPCKFCGKLFPAVFSLQLHERTHTGIKHWLASVVFLLQNQLGYLKVFQLYYQLQEKDLSLAAFVIDDLQQKLQCKNMS